MVGWAARPFEVPAVRHRPKAWFSLFQSFLFSICNIFWKFRFSHFHPHFRVRTCYSSTRPDGETNPSTSRVKNLWEAQNFGHDWDRTSCILLQLRSKVKILPEGDYEYPASSCSENVEPQPSVFVGRSNPMPKCDHTIQGGNAINLILTLSHQRNFCFRLR